ncbi:MAG: hypothetical protein V1858_02375 [Candidatus Gottesmanbacteria bacterium]
MIVLISQTINASYDFDEGVFLQVSTNLRYHLTYASFERLFDYNITTGPTVIIPASLFVNTILPFLPRLVINIYVIVLLWLLLKHIYILDNQKIIFLVLVLFTPLFFFFSTHVLGEIPALTLLIFSYYFFTKKKYFLTGIFIALSVLTKNIFFISIIPIIIVWFMQVITNKDYNKQIQNLSIIIAGGLMILILWNLYILISIQFNLPKFIEIWSSTIIFNGSLSHPNPLAFYDRLRMINYVFFLNPILFITIMLFIGIYVLFTKSKKEIIFFKMVALFQLFFSLYFLFICSTNWYRYFFPSILSFIIIIPYFLTVFLKKLNKNKIVLLLLFISIFIVDSFIERKRLNNPAINLTKLVEQNLLFVGESKTPYFKENLLLKKQKETANFVNISIPYVKKISGIGIYRAPEISYLTGRPIGRDPENDNADYIIYQTYGMSNPWTSDIYSYLDKVLPKEKVFDNQAYKIFKLLNN